MSVCMLKNDWVRGHGLRERMMSRKTIGAPDRCALPFTLMPAVTRHRDALAEGGGTVRYPLDDVVEICGIAKVYRPHRSADTCDMEVCVNKSRVGDTLSEFDDVRLWPAAPKCLFPTSDVTEAALCNRHGLHLGSLAVHGV